MTRYMNASRASRYGRGRGTGMGKSASAKLASAVRVCSFVHPALRRTASTSARGSPFTSADLMKSDSSSGTVDIVREPFCDGRGPLARAVQRRDRTRRRGILCHRLHVSFEPGDVVPGAKLVADLTIHA